MLYLYSIFCKCESCWCLCQSTIDQDGGPGGSGVLTYIPSTLTRWTEEAKVLDGDSVHDCVTGMLIGYRCYR